MCRAAAIYWILTSAICLVEVTAVAAVKEDSYSEHLSRFSPIFAPVSINITNGVCRIQSNIFLEQLKAGTLWALQMHDSSAKLPSGILRGNINQLGDFDQCLSITTDETIGIQGKYCLAFVDIKAAKETAELVDYVECHSPIRTTNTRIGQALPYMTTINWGVCVPASCTPADVQLALVEALQLYSQPTGIAFDVYVNPEMCYVKSDGSLDRSAIGALIFFGCFILLASVATIMEKFLKSRNETNQGTVTRMLMAFSVPKNIRTLTDDVPPEIPCFDGIRVICMLVVYVVHKGISVFSVPFVNKMALFQVCTELWRYLVIVPLLVTDTFYIVSATLASYNLSKKLCNTRRVNWVNYFISRYIRLTPAYFALIVIHAYLVDRLGDGPSWNTSMKYNAERCKEYFWWNMLYINNFISLSHQCAPHTYYLAMDMQLSLLLPVLVTLLWKWRRLGVAALLLLYASSTLLRYLATVTNSLVFMTHTGLNMDSLKEFFDIVYQKPQSRVSSYVLGVGLGYLLCKTRGSNTHVSKFVLGTGWLLSACLFHLVIILPEFTMPLNSKYDAQQQAVYAAYIPALWSLIVGWLVWTCHMGKAGTLNKFLGLKIFKVGSKISYSFYLVHVFLILWKVGSIRAPIQFSVTEIVFDVCEIATILAAAVVMTLLFDFPFQEIKKILLDDGEIYKNSVGSRNEAINMKRSCPSMSDKTKLN